MKIQQTTFLIFITFVASNLFADEQASADPETKSCISRASANDKILDSSTQDEGNAFPGSTGYSFCEKLSGGNMKQLYESKKFGEFNWEASIANSICKSECSAYLDHLKKYDIKSTTPNSPESTKILSEDTKLRNDYKTCFQKYSKRVPECVSLLHVMSKMERDYKNNVHTTPVSPNSNATPAVINQTAQTKTTQANVNVSSNDEYGCKNEGIETVDYEVCKKFSDYAAGLEVASQAVNVGQNLYYQNKAIDTGADASKNMATDATAALKAQKTNFKDQESYYTQNSAIEASKAAYLATIRASMPSRDEVLTKCDGIDSAYPEFKTSNPNITGNITNEVCKSVVNSPTKKFNILANESAKEKMTAKLVKLGVNAIAEGTKAYFAGKRADQVDSAIASVNNFQPTTTPGLEQAVETTYCTMNPTAAKCIGSTSSDFSTIGDNIVDFGNNGAGTVYSGATDSGTTDSSGSSSGSSSSNSNSKGVIGSAITSVNKGSGIETVAAAAAIQKSNSPSGGGGGGGGGGGSMGGGSGAIPTQGSQGGVTAAVAGKTPNYGVSGGGISMLGGKMASNKKADSSANPFGNLVGAKKENDKLVNFRGPASTNVGNKGDNLFDMIHNRYNWANDKKLMLEYEEATK